eukprot:snap_masked-scaffold_5-processed-gene-3.6-mRNA-1 protein AED:1.00 eAED:1.00 QI:0/0/0/0/1/1/3/0/67
MMFSLDLKEGQSNTESCGIEWLYKITQGENITWGKGSNVILCYIQAKAVNYGRSKNTNYFNVQYHFF